MKIVTLAKSELNYILYIVSNKKQTEKLNYFFLLLPQILMKLQWLRHT